MNRIFVMAIGLFIGCSAHKEEDDAPQRLFDAATIETLAPLDDAPGIATDALGDGGCADLACKRPKCEAGGTTTLVGKVYAPRKKDPDALYGVAVYVPRGELTPLGDGVSCDRCGGAGTPSVLASALSRADGTFELRDVPAGKDIPLVVQVGKFRRKVLIPEVVPCTKNELPAELTRLPRNRAEGDLPRIAVATGTADPMECLLRKIGLDDVEFGPSTKGATVHLYKQSSPLSGFTVDAGPDTLESKSLFGRVDALTKYDIVLLPCEAIQNTKSKEWTDNMVAYAGLGGRVFATHYSYSWIVGAGGGFAATAKWSVGGLKLIAPALSAIVDTSFPKGAAFAQWLTAVGASTEPGRIIIENPRKDAEGVNAPAQRWIHSTEPVASLQHYTFNTPTGAATEAQCGRVVFSDFHVNSIGKDGKSFPLECDDLPLTAQEKALEFMLFDLASCVRRDDEEPKPPVVK